MKTAEDAEDAEEGLKKFTVILEFRDGTYIRQLKALTPRAALKQLGALNDEKGRVFRKLAVDKPVPIKGVEGCWCACASVGKDLALVNIVKTSN